MQTIISRMDDNSQIFKRLLDDEESGEFVQATYLDRVYEQLRETA